MNQLAARYGWLEAPQVRHDPNDTDEHPKNACRQAYVSLKNESDEVIVYERAGLLFVFNFHPTKSFTDYRVGVDEGGEYRIVLSSDEGRFGGFDNITLESKCFTNPMEWNGRRNFVQVRFLVNRLFTF